MLSSGLPHGWKKDLKRLCDCQNCKSIKARLKHPAKAALIRAQPLFGLLLKQHGKHLVDAKVYTVHSGGLHITATLKPFNRSPGYVDQGLLLEGDLNSGGKFSEIISTSVRKKTRNLFRDSRTERQVCAKTMPPHLICVLSSI